MDARRESIVLSAPGPSGTSDLRIMRDDGSDRRHLVDTGGEDWTPRVSPDGSTIAFTTDVAGQQDVWLVRSDGTDAHLLTTGSPDMDQSEGWSPDGRYVFFISDRSHTGGVFLYFVPVSGGRARLAIVI